MTIVYPKGSDNFERPTFVLKFSPEQMRLQQEYLAKGDWNEQFLRALALPESPQKYRMLSTLSTDFIFSAQTYGWLSLFLFCLSSLFCR
jgi:hypothetical protein